MDRLLLSSTTLIYFWIRKFSLFPQSRASTIILVVTKSMSDRH